MNNRNTLLTKQAADAYKAGDFSEALRLYRLLAQKLGTKAFSLNIRLAEAKLATANDGDSPPQDPQKQERRQPPKALAILDEISNECWKHEITINPIIRGDYASQVASSKSQFALLESCWKGNGGAWEYAFTSPGLKHSNAKALLDLIEQLKKKGLPIVFWNKEDPMHYDRFLPIAKHADIIVTTDSNALPKYNKDALHSRAFALPFAAQQKFCNPSNRFRTHCETICFAGSYYSVGHDERKEQMQALLPTIIRLNGAIYDRFSRLNDDRYAFPSEFKPYIRDSIPFQEMIHAYKKFKLFLNVNTVTTSPTMMSRRVYELLACGTPVISAPSKALEQQFSGIVQIAKNSKEATEIAELLISNDDLWDRISHLGYREVMTKHTYGHRMEALMQALNLGKSSAQPLVSIITCTKRPEMSARIVQNITKQNYCYLELILTLQGFREDERVSLLSRLRAAKSNIKNIKVIINNNANDSLGERFNNACAHANGEYIAKMDDDDIYFPSYLSDMLIPFSFGDYAMVGKKELFMYLASSNKMIKRFSGYKHCTSDFVAGPTFVIKKKVFDSIKFKPQNTGEDTSFIKDLCAKGYSIYAADSFNFVQYRGKPTSHTWRISDEEILSGRHSSVVSNSLDTSIVEI